MKTVVMYGIKVDVQLTFFQAGRKQVACVVDEPVGTSSPKSANIFEHVSPPQIQSNRCLEGYHGYRGRFRAKA